MIRLTTLLVCLALAGCSATLRSDDVAPSGFLKDTHQLTPGKGDRAALVYVRPGLDLSRYEALYIEPITVLVTQDSALADVPPEEAQALASLLHTKLVEHVGADIPVVDGPGANTLRLRAALTEASNANVPLDVVSTVLPIGWVSSAVSTLSTGTPVFVGGASVEAELLDATTGLRLMAAIDRRVGSKTLRTVGSWSDVEAAFDLWAERFHARLVEYGVR